VEIWLLNGKLFVTKRSILKVGQERSMGRGNDSILSLLGRCGNPLVFAPEIGVGMGFGRSVEKGKPGWREVRYRPRSTD